MFIKVTEQTNGGNRVQYLAVRHITCIIPLLRAGGCEVRTTNTFHYLEEDAETLIQMCEDAVGPVWVRAHIESS